MTAAPLRRACPRGHADAAVGEGEHEAQLGGLRVTGAVGRDHAGELGLEEGAGEVVAAAGGPREGEVVEGVDAERVVGRVTL